MERVLQLRDLVHDHLDPGRVLHHLRSGLEQRRPDRHLVGLAADLLHDPAGRVLHVRAGVGVSDRRRHLLVGERAGRRRLGLVHRLVQPRRPRRGRRVGRLRLRDVHLRAAEPVERRPRRRELRRRRGAGRRVHRVRVRARAARADQHLLVAPRRAVQQRVGLVARRRRRGDHRDPHLRAREPPGLLVRLRRDDQQLRLQPGHVLALRAAARLPAHAVHDHRLRRVRAHLRGDARRGGRRAQGRLALGLLLGADRLGPAARAHVRRDRRRRDQRRRRRLARRSSTARCPTPPRRS